MKLQKHHITPRCLLKHKDKSFIDRPDNLVMLTYEQHIKAHKWLYMLLGSSLMESAYMSMKHGKFINKGGYSNPFSQEHKDNMSKVKKGIVFAEKNNFYGKKHSEESKKMMSASKKITALGNINCLGFKHSKDTRKKMSESGKGKIRNFRKCIIKGIHFNSLKEAGEYFKVYPATIRRWINYNKESCYYNKEL